MMYKVLIMWRWREKTKSFPSLETPNIVSIPITALCNTPNNPAPILVWHTFHGYPFLMVYYCAKRGNDAIIIASRVTTSFSENDSTLPLSAKDNYLRDQSKLCNYEISVNETKLRDPLMLALRGECPFSTSRISSVGSTLIINYIA